MIFAILAVGIGIGVPLFIRWLDTRRDAPVMQESINRGSDKFFAAEEERKRFELDDAAFDHLADD